MKEDLRRFSFADESWTSQALEYVNGVAAAEVRKLIPLDTRRQFGIFFTDTELARKVLDILQPDINEDSCWYDPACGAGNLLIAGMHYFKEKNVIPRKADFILGSDIHYEFIDAAQIRLEMNRLLLATAFDLRSFSPILIQADGLKNNALYAKATHIFVNPPFNQMIPEKEVTWASGKINFAAIFIDSIIGNCSAGATICAILPDVLRSGTRYQKWRAYIRKRCIIEKVELLGQFDKFADVDVFAIKLTKRATVLGVEQSEIDFAAFDKPELTVSSLFYICVGPVVDNRDEHKGRKRGYIISKKLPGWSVYLKYQKTRQHQGRCFKGPFVVVKRTSRMGDSQRAIATIVNTPNPVYVDNHLIVLIPKSGTLSQCKKIINNLKDARTDSWLNDTIRCRHLTVSSIANIPIWD